MFIVKAAEKKISSTPEIANSDVNEFLIVKPLN
jgi:hypothetical protein